jgi:hypothetical protein
MGSSGPFPAGTGARADAKTQLNEPESMMAAAYGRMLAAVSEADDRDGALDNATEAGGRCRCRTRAVPCSAPGPRGRADDRPRPPGGRLPGYSLGNSSRTGEGFQVDEDAGAS